MLQIPVGTTLIELHETESTNRDAAELIRTGHPAEGTVIMAYFQKAGRGQRGNHWESEQGHNLLVSFILYPVFLKATDHFVLNQALCLAVWEFIKEQTTEIVSVKWPNDIMAGDRKIAGLLIENSLRGPGIQHTIAGIGININQVLFQHYQPEATSLRILNNRTYDLKMCLEKLSGHISKWYTILAIGNKRLIHETYTENLFRRGQLHRFATGEKEFMGVIQKTMPQGELVIVQEDGYEYVFKNKEVRFLF